ILSTDVQSGTSLIPFQFGAREPLQARLFVRTVMAIASCKEARTLVRPRGTGRRRGQVLGPAQGAPLGQANDYYLAAQTIGRPAIVSSSPTGTNAPGVRKGHVTFNEPVQDSSCQASQMAAASIPQELLHDRALRTFRTRLAPQVIARLGSCRTNDHRPDLA